MPARRRAGCGCCGRRARSSSRSFCSGTGRSASTASASPDLVAEEGGVTARLWRLDPEFGDALTEELQDAQLLIADGHHRYETALAFHERGRHRGVGWLLVVIVPTDQEGLTIFPTHRIAQSVDGVKRHADRPSG